MDLSLVTLQPLLLNVVRQDGHAFRTVYVLLRIQGPPIPPYPSLQQSDQLVQIPNGTTQSAGNFA
jgi:hypothetical protein